MQESIHAAHSFIKFRAAEFGIDIARFENSDIHIHVPEGATPKDGPSAGITMCVSIVSAFTGISVRKDIAMTGEVTLRGRVLPIGGLKEKLLAALRSGIKTVFIPEDNVKDLEEIPEAIKDGLEIIPVSHVDQVIQHALTEKPLPFIPKDIVVGNKPSDVVTVDASSKKKDNVIRH
jgi:ATP-dependent Lon protease